MTTMTYVNIFTKDIKKLSKFYIDVFGFEEDRKLRTPIFRSVRTSKSFFGFNALEAYGLLNLEGNENSVDHGALVELVRRPAAPHHDPATRRALQNQCQAFLFLGRPGNGAVGERAQHTSWVERNEFIELAESSIAVALENEREAMAAAAFQIAHAKGVCLRRIERVQPLAELNFIAPANNGHAATGLRPFGHIRAVLIERALLLIHGG